MQYPLQGAAAHAGARRARHGDPAGQAARAGSLSPSSWSRWPAPASGPSSGRFPARSPPTGLLTHPLGVSELQTMYAGQVSQLSVTPGDQVTRPARSCWRHRHAGTLHPVISPFTGTVVSVATAAGQVVTAGSTDAHRRAHRRSWRPPARDGVRPGQPGVRAAAGRPGGHLGLHGPGRRVRPAARSGRVGEPVPAHPGGPRHPARRRSWRSASSRPSPTPSSS